MYQEKDRTMDNVKIIDRTTLNGTKWQIEVDNYGAALFIQNFGKEGFHYSGHFFDSMEEANAYLDGIDESVKNPTPFTPCSDCSNFYGRGSSVYYGD